MKRSLVAVGELKREGKALPCSPQLGTHALGDNFFASLHMSANDHKSTRGTDLGVTHKFWQIGRFVNIESAKN